MKITITKALLLIGSINVIVGNLLGEFQFSFPGSEILLIILSVLSLLIIVLIFLRGVWIQRVLMISTLLVAVIYLVTLIFGLVYGIEHVWYYVLSMFIIAHAVILYYLFLEYKEMNVIESYLWFDGEKLR